MAMSMTAYVGLGSNLGDRAKAIRQAVDALNQTPETCVTGVSDIIETRPLGGRRQPAYFNAVCRVRTTLGADALHTRLREIEAGLGRVRTEDRWSPRTIDLDLLLFGDQVSSTAELTIPHPEMHLRSFVLRGLVQLDPGMVHPVIGETVTELAVRLNGGDFIKDEAVPQLVCLAGTIGVGKTTWAKGLATKLGGQVLFEPYDTNPFLPAVYAGKKELGLDSQLFFLVNRAGQLSPASLGGGQVYLADYLFEQEEIYARRLLDPQQLALYRDIYAAFASKPCTPRLVLFLQDSAEHCLERISLRNRSYERGIQAAFLQGLAEDYEALFVSWMRCPVIRVRADRWSGLSDADVDRLARQVAFYIKAPPGKEG
jgi:2-amino-4-hydroxy-6-hydroxymethyldihydropteridine diphosphokinase